jgi:hypothetical protein
MISSSKTEFSSAFCRKCDPANASYPYGESGIDCRKRAKLLIQMDKDTVFNISICGDRYDFGDLG